MAEGDGMDGASGGIGSRTVFLSYASQDTEVANTVCRELESRGIRCWIAPRDVAPGALYADAIVRAINESNVLVVVLSQSAVASSHVGREVERAASKRKQIIAFRVDTANLSPELEYFLSNSQWIDVPALGMQAALTKLADAVGRDSAPSSKANPAVGAAATPIGKRSGGAPRKSVVVAVVVIVVAVCAAVLAMRFWPSKHGDAQVPAVAQMSDKSIAVLPFADMSQKKDQEYFGDGMAEEILDLLAKIPGLTVIGRTSSFQFKGKNEDLRTIGTKLNAAHVMEGSVRNSGDQVRITAQLINTKTGAHEWSETYDRPIGDVLKLQDGIAAAVARELQLTVVSGGARSILKDPEAYTLVLRGRHAFDRSDPEGDEEAVSLFQQALVRDSTSADAEAWLAMAYLYQVADNSLASADGFERARRETVIALKLDPNNVLVHVVMAQIHMRYDWDWAGTERELQKAASLAPSNVDVLASEARLSATLGRWDYALRKIKAAVAQDPLDANFLQLLSTYQAARGNLRAAEAAMRRALDIRPMYAYGHYNLGLIYLMRGDGDGALREMQQETIDDGKQQGLALAYYALGRKADADAALAVLIKEQADGNALDTAEVYAFRGESDEAMHWLERAYAQKDPWLFQIKFSWFMKNVEADPRYKAFLRKMNLPE
jgi:TolB-like protein/tetratricopeptide (TPR) repeat protein